MVAKDQSSAIVKKGIGYYQFVYKKIAIGEKLSIVVVGKIRCKCSKNIY